MPACRCARRPWKNWEDVKELLEVERRATERDSWGIAFSRVLGDVQWPPAPR